MSGINFAKLKIMVVEDHEPTRQMLEALLQGSGAKAVVAVANAVAAIDHLKDGPFDILIADLHLGAIDGLALIKTIRQNPKLTNRYMPIIVLTADTRMDIVAQARQLGVNHFLAKPLDAERLLKAITSVLERPSVFVQTKDYFGPARGPADSSVKQTGRALQTIEGTRVVWN